MSRKSRIMAICLILGILIVVFLVLAVQKVDNKNIIFEGNEKYTNDEMINFIFESKWDKNPFVIYFKTKYGKQKVIPFVDEYNIEIVSLNSVKVTVYEKKIIGYVSYMGTYMYFDKDGTVVESSLELLEGVPKVTGLEFDSIILHEKLPVEEDEVFDLILDTTQALKKYSIPVDKIYISGDKEVTLYIDEIEVMLGRNIDMDDKVRTLRDMMPNLEGLRGELDLKEYNTGDSGYTFKKSDS